MEAVKLVIWIIGMTLVVINMVLAMFFSAIDKPLDALQHLAWAILIAVLLKD
jgi:uncharacterized protein YpmB